jgi:hypothetical protein
MQGDRETEVNRIIAVSFQHFMEIGVSPVIVLRRKALEDAPIAVTDTDILHIGMMTIYLRKGTAKTHADNGDPDF